MRYLLFLLAILMTGCFSKGISVDNQDIEITRIDSILNNYSHVKQLIGTHGTDENTFLFERQSGWDTTYVLAIRKDTASITAIYHGLSPHYSETMAFYEGVSFQLDSSTWERVISEARNLLDTLNPKPYTDCVDCSLYALGHNSKFTHMNKGNRVQFERYERFLWQNLIYPVLRKKREFNEGERKRKE